MRSAIGIPGLLFLFAALAQAQGNGGGNGGGNQPAATAVTAVQPLMFGQLVPALAEQVAVTEGWRRAEVRLEGTGNLEVRFVLPTQLASPSGGVIPLTFGASDGGYILDGSTQLNLFDPNQTVKINLKKNVPGAQLVLGGTATPSATQVAGSYGATVVIVLSPNNL